MKKRRKYVNYKEYMQSPEWQAKSKAFIKQAGCCERCGSIHLLGAHHLNYECLGHEVRGDLAIYCWDCHQKYHKRDGKRIKKIFKGISSRESRLIGKRKYDAVGLINQREVVSKVEILTEKQIKKIKRQRIASGKSKKQWRRIMNRQRKKQGKERILGFY